MLNGTHEQQAVAPVQSFQLCEGMQDALTPKVWAADLVINHRHFDGPHSEQEQDLISRALVWHQVRWPWFMDVDCADCVAGKFRDAGGHWHGCELCISALLANACTVCVHLLAIGQPQLRCTVLTSYAEFAEGMGWVKGDDSD